MSHDVLMYDTLNNRLNRKINVGGPDQSFPSVLNRTHWNVNHII